MKHTAFAAFLGVMLQVTAAFAQGQGGGSPVYQNWFPVGTPATLSVSNVTANVALPTGGLTARVCNTGATDAYVVLGTANTVVATTTAGSFLASGKCQPFNLLPFATRYTYIAAITASSTTTIRVESGLGSPIASDAAGASAPPSGPAGGDLAGTYPNPTVAKASNGFTVPSSGAVSVSPVLLSGTILTGGTGTTNFPALFIQPTGTTAATTWSTTGTGIGMNLASGFTGNFIDFQKAGGGSQFTVSGGGAVFANGTLSTNGRVTTTSTTEQLRLGFDGSNYTSFTVGSSGTLTLGGAGTGASSLVATGGLVGGSYSIGFYNGSALQMASGNRVAWTSGVINATIDTGFSRDSVIGAGNLDLGNGSANDKSGTLNTANIFLNGGAIVTGMTNPVLVAKTAGTSKDAIDWENSSGVNIGVLGSDSGGNGVLRVKDSSANTRVTLGSNSGFAQIVLTNSPDQAFISMPAAATVQLGSVDGAAPVAQTLGVQNVVAGTTNTVGQPWILNGSQSTGTAAGGSVLIKTSPADVTHTVNTFTGSASPYTIGFTAGNITTYPIGTVMTVSGCTTATLNGTYTVTASSSGSVTATTSATGTGSPTTCLIVGNTSQNPEVTAVTIDPSANKTTFAGNVQAALVGPASGGQLRFWGSGTAMQNPSDGVITFLNNAGSSFGRLQLGGTTSSYPSIKLNGTAINFRLADDSADAPITASAITNSGSLIAGGSAPTPTGTCTRGTQNGGNTTGSIVLTCTAQTLILTFATTAPTGYMCEAIDQTTTADTMKQTANSTTTCTLTGTTAASDVVIYQARAY